MGVEHGPNSWKTMRLAWIVLAIAAVATFVFVAVLSPLPWLELGQQGTAATRATRGQAEWL